MTHDSAAKFDASRAGEYARQCRIALAGYDACHELSACMLSASLGEGKAARVLVVGAGGTAGEIITAARLEPEWSFVAVDPSPPMLDLARTYLVEAGVSDRVETVLGAVADLDSSPSFDAAIMIGVLHHLQDDAAKQDILAQIATRLRPRRALGRRGKLPGLRFAAVIHGCLGDPLADEWLGAGRNPVQDEQDSSRRGAAPVRGSGNLPVGRSRLSGTCTVLCQPVLGRLAGSTHSDDQVGDPAG